MKSKWIKSVLPVVALMLTVACERDDADVNPMTDDMLSLRKVMGRYYENKGFHLGGALPYDYLSNKKDSLPQALTGVFYREYALQVASGAFRSTVVAPSDDKTYWANSDYRNLIVQARNQTQSVRAVCPVGSDCSVWTKTDTRTPEELRAAMEYYVKGVGSELRLNGDVVQMMDVVENCVAAAEVYGTGYDGAQESDIVRYGPGDWMGPRKGTDTRENPWTMLGFDAVTLDGVEYTFPNYISRTFELANATAPNIRKYIVQEDPELAPEVWGQVKNLILALREKGLRVDGICWKARIKMGWEKDEQRMLRLSQLIDWCYLNNVEFHVSELAVCVSSGSAVEDLHTLEQTRGEQAATFAAVTEIVAAKAGRGACSLGFGNLDGSYTDGDTYAGLYPREGLALPAYDAVREVLLRCAKQ